MDINRAIDIFDDGDWWKWFKARMPKKTRDEMLAAFDFIGNILYAFQDKENERLYQESLSKSKETRSNLIHMNSGRNAIPKKIRIKGKLLTAIRQQMNTSDTTEEFLSSASFEKWLEAELQNLGSYSNLYRRRK